MLDSPVDVSGESTKKSPEPEMRDEYDFSNGARGKYAARVAEGTNVVVLDPDVAAHIKSPEEVNRILREHLAEHRR